MWKAISRAQRRVYPARIRRSRIGVTGLFSLAALLLIIAVGWLLDLGGERSDVREFGVYVQEARRDPVDALVQASRLHRFVFLSDIYGAAATKRLASEAIEAIATGPGLDAVVVEVGRDQQQYLDRYFSRAQEDATVLLSHPRALRESGTGAREYLALYHRIWQLNERLGADRRIQVIAADIPGWPPEQALSTAERTRLYRGRGAAMSRNLEERLLSKTPRARVLMFVTGLHALKTGTGQLQTGGSAAVQTRWFAADLEERYPGEVHSVLTDAAGSGSPDELVQYRGTRLPDAAESALPAGRYAVTVNSAFDFLSHPIRESTSPGLMFDILPRQYRLRNVADDYIYLGN